MDMKTTQAYIYIPHIHPVDRYDTYATHRSCRWALSLGDADGFANVWTVTVFYEPASVDWLLLN